MSALLYGSDIRCTTLTHWRQKTATWKNRRKIYKLIIQLSYVVYCSILHNKCILMLHPYCCCWNTSHKKYTGIERLICHRSKRHISTTVKQFLKMHNFNLHLILPVVISAFWDVPRVDTTAEKGKRVVAVVESISAVKMHFTLYIIY